MAPVAVHLDVSEILAAPLRTGIQRVEREAIRHWPGPAPLRPCCIDPSGRLLHLPDAVLEVLCAEDIGSEESRERERRRLAELRARAEFAMPGDVTCLLNMELFLGVARANAHIRLAASRVRVLWYLYDFLPFLRPELFATGSSRHFMHFLRALRSATCVSFLSKQTQAEYMRRIVRGRSRAAVGPVIPPGADGLRLEKQVFSPERRDFVSIGTIEQRKNSGALLRAFELLWMQQRDIRLTVIGRISPEAREAHAFFGRYRGDPRLVIMEQPSDAVLRQVLRRARALIMPSEAEGFGLPPYEALHAGIPAVASMSLPSAAMISQGALLLERMVPEAIADAVERLTDDCVADRLWQAAATVHLPTWENFGIALGAWAQAEAVG